MALFVFTENPSWVRAWRLHLLLQLTTVKKQCAVFVTSPNRTPSCPNFRFPPTSSTLTIPDIRMCLYQVTFKTWAGPGSFYTAWEALDQIRSAPGDSWDFWVILKTNVFLKDVIAFHFVKNLYVSMNFITKYIKWRTFSSFYFQFSKLPSWFKACALLWMEKERTENLLPDQCPPLSNNIPSFSLIGPKKKKVDLKFWWISFVLLLAFQNVPALLTWWRRPPWFRL